MAERLAAGNVAIALLANTIATGAGLVALILAFGPISGAHPSTPRGPLAEAFLGNLPWSEALLYIAAQLAGAFIGVAAAHLMFGAPIFSLSHHVRSGPAQVFSEFVATFGLLAIILGCTRRTRAKSGAPPAPSLGGMKDDMSGEQTGSPFTAIAVGAYITSAYWFTASTSFANPAVTLARSLLPIPSPASALPMSLPFLAAQGLAVRRSCAALLFRLAVPIHSCQAPKPSYLPHPPHDTVGITVTLHPLK